MGATISDCGRYRYDLTRETGEGAGSILWVMLNPSTADATEDDPTIRKCVGFARRWGFRRVKVVNLFAFRATDPAELCANIDELVDVRNLKALLNEVQAHDRVVLAWGGGLKHVRPHLWLADYASRLYFDPVCLGVNNDGTPKHPLYLKYETEPIPFTWTRKEIDDGK